MDKTEKKPDPEELLFTLDQLEQTSEIMAKVIARLKRQLHLLQQSPSPNSTANKPCTKTPPSVTSKQRRTLH
ncbi:hypothetical protein [Gilvimarinus chinensis]|uniref:hypothetical protein n=1 Tax=Gilvimarinus chinensis TaxID=396005 RepID=UPI00038252CC|nr:hypothetical protein [Gilvimarinus chinensis]